MTAVTGMVAPVGKRPRIEPKKLGTLTEEEAFWHPIILASFAVVLLFGALARWTSIVVSALVTLSLALVGVGCAFLATLTAASRKAKALDGLRAAIASKDPQHIRIAICRAAVLGVTVKEASAVKEVQCALAGAGARLSCVSKAASARDLRQKVALHECEQHSAGCENQTTRPNCVAEAPATTAVACVLSAVPADSSPETFVTVAPSVPLVPHVPAESTQRVGRKRAQEVWFDGDAAPWILL